MTRLFMIQLMSCLPLALPVRSAWSILVLDTSTTQVVLQLPVLGGAQFVRTHTPPLSRYELGL